MGTAIFDQVTLVGAGLIGASLAHNIARYNLAKRLVVVEANEGRCGEVAALGLVDEVGTDLPAGVADADLIILCTPVGTYNDLAAQMAPALKPGAIVSDVGSVKAQVIADVARHLPAGVHLVPGHPIAGTEKSGPSAGFQELFENRWAILTPPPGTDQAVIDQVSALWQGCGAKVEVMTPEGHDLVLAITSHLPHLIAYTIVDTASQLEDSLKSEVIKYSASGFRDFTRIAGSDPTMWRDIFLTNREAVLEILQRFTEDLSYMQRAIRQGDGQTLFDRFTETRAIRREVVEQGQAGTFDPREPKTRPEDEQVLTPYGGPGV